jgi:hypothetical protein
MIEVALTVGGRQKIFLTGTFIKFMKNSQIATSDEHLEVIAKALKAPFVVFYVFELFIGSKPLRRTKFQSRAHF